MKRLPELAIHKAQGVSVATMNRLKTEEVETILAYWKKNCEKNDLFNQEE